MFIKLSGVYKGEKLEIKMRFWYFLTILFFHLKYNIKLWMKGYSTESLEDLFQSICSTAIKLKEEQHGL